MQSWISVSGDSDFPIQNLPFGIFSTVDRTPRAGVAIGDFVVDLFTLHSNGLLESLGFDTSIFGQPSLNSFMALERKFWRATRQRLQELLVIGGDNRLQANTNLTTLAIIPIGNVQMHLPAVVGDYTDFYSSREHATNVGIMFRGKDNALQPNWLHLPVGYHGRSSSVVLSGTNVVRPSGQLQRNRDDPSQGSIYSPCRLLDYELEMAFFIGGPSNTLGAPVTMAEAEDRIFGVVIMNDWSARDIQAWEYVPLGPFTAKNFCTSISPWVVTLDALEEFRCHSSAGPQQVDPAPLEYLQDPNYATGSYDIALEVSVKPEGDPNASVITRSNMKYLYWNMKQQLVHHSVTGCPLVAGDLLGTGTISGPEDTNFGSMLELSWRGSKDIPLEHSPSVTRKFLQDGDTVRMVGRAEGAGYRIGFGSVEGKVLPSGSVSPPPSASAAPVAVAPPSVPSYRLYSYWRSGCAWRVRIAMNLKSLPFEYVPINLAALVGSSTAKLPPEFAEKNRLEQVPVLEFASGGAQVRLTQSLAIIEYLDEVHPTASFPLLPKDPILRARVRQISEICNSGIQPLQNLNIVRRVKAAEIPGDEEGVAQTVDGTGFAKAMIDKGLQGLEDVVAECAAAAAGTQSSPVFAAGTAHPTMADVCVVPQLLAAKRFGVDVDRFPHLRALLETCQALPSFQLAAPERQPDFPGSA